VELARRRLRQWPRSGSLLGVIARWISGDKAAEKIDEHLQLGDSRAAVVLSCAPLLVSAYTDELDCVAVLAFPQSFVEKYGLEVGSRLLTVNTYFRGTAVVSDLFPGPASYFTFYNFNPMIAEFLSEDAQRIAERKAEIDEAEWERCLALGREYVQTRPGVVRDGSPFKSALPARTNAQ